MIRENEAEEKEKEKMSTDLALQLANMQLEFSGNIVKQPFTVFLPNLQSTIDTNLKISGSEIFPSILSVSSLTVSSNNTTSALPTAGATMIFNNSLNNASFEKGNCYVEKGGVIKIKNPLSTPKTIIVKEGGVLESDVPLGAPLTIILEKGGILKGPVTLQAPFELSLETGVAPTEGSLTIEKTIVGPAKITFPEPQATNNLSSGCFSNK